MYYDQLYIISKFKIVTENELSACALCLFMLNECWNDYLEFPKLGRLENSIMMRMKVLHHKGA